MMTTENGPFYRDVLGIPADQTEHRDDVHPCLVALSPEEADKLEAELAGA